MYLDIRAARQREHQLESDSRWDVHECRRLQREGNEELLEAISPFGEQESQRALSTEEAVTDQRRLHMEATIPKDAVHLSGLQGRGQAIPDPDSREHHH